MYEDVKRRLQSYRYCLWRINRNKELITELRATAEKVSPVYSLAPGGGSGDSMTNAAAKIVDLEREIAADSARLADELALVEFLIASLEDFRQRQVVEYRYIHDYSWRQIQEELKYDERYIRRLHGRALENLAKIKIGPEKPTLTCVIL